MADQKNSPGDLTPESREAIRSFLEEQLEGNRERDRQAVREYIRTELNEEFLGPGAREKIREFLYDQLKVLGIFLGLANVAAIVLALWYIYTNVPNAARVEASRLASEVAADIRASMDREISHFRQRVEEETKRVDDARQSVDRAARV